MNLKTKTFLGALVAVTLAYGYYAYNDSGDAQNSQSDTSVVITTPAEEIKPVQNESANEGIETTTPVVTPTEEVETTPQPEGTTTVE